MSGKRLYHEGATCQEPGCSNPPVKKWLCQKHYYFMRKQLGPKNTRTCRICGRGPVQARELCTGHYHRWQNKKLLDFTPLQVQEPRGVQCDECEEPVHARHKCQKHYRQMLKARRDILPQIPV